MLFRSVWNDTDPLTGAPRDAVFISEPDAARIGVGQGDAVMLRSEHGAMRAVVHVSKIRPGNVQVFFPEGNALLAAHVRDDASGVPDYNAIVEIEPAS